MTLIFCITTFAQAQKPFFVSGEGVKFIYNMPGAKSVSIVGDFNQWNPTNKPMKKNAQGTWVVLLPLNEGKYQYGFVVDGKKPVIDKTTIEIKRNTDGKLYVENTTEKKTEEQVKQLEQVSNTTTEAVTTVTKENTGKSTETNSLTTNENYPLGALPPQVYNNDVKLWYNSPKSKDMSIAGSFNNWDLTKDKMVKNEKGIWELILSLKPGQYEYQYIIDGTMAGGPKWMIIISESTKKE